MEITYKRELDHNYLVVWQDTFQDCYQTGMIVRNQIPGLLRCRLSIVDERAAFYYEITSKQSLRLLLERKRISAEELTGLLDGLHRAVRNCEEYLLDGSRILLDPDYIYLEPDTWETAFCYVPFWDQDLQEELLGLAEYLLERLERQDQNAVTLGYEFYRMAGETHSSLEQLLENYRVNCIKQERKEIQISESEGRYRTERKQDCDGTEEPHTAVRNCETVCLKRDEKKEVTLRSENSLYPDLRITGKDFLIGKKRDAVDGFIKARGISRIHAKISQEGEGYYLTDLNSTNGTYLNGGRLEVNEKARIRPGDRIGFADVRYVVEG